MRAGCDVTLAVDKWDHACEAHRRWHTSIPTIEQDCAETTGLAELLWASPSCKPWSVANRTPKRGKMHPEYYSLAGLVQQAFECLGARWLIVENVGGLIWSKEGRVEMADMRAEVKRRGLRLSMPKRGTINSNSVGVAQLRRRVFLVVGHEYVAIPQGGEWVPPAGTAPLLWEAQDATRAGLPVLKDDHPNKWSDAYRFGRAQLGVVDVSFPSRHTNWTRAQKGVCGDEHGNATSPERLRERRAGTALGADGRDVGKGTRDGHVKERSRGTGRSIEECAALQQVPLWPLEGMPKRVKHELIGNAVPPPLAEHVVRQVLVAESGGS